MTTTTHDEPQSLGELFKGADRIGRKYQDPKGVEAYEQQLFELRKEIEALSDPR